MTIHKEGFRTIAFAAIVVIALNAASFYYISDDYAILAWGILILSLIFWLFVVSFFRIPTRQLMNGEELVICPADGKVVVIEEAFDSEYFNEKRLQISIFMSPANVHQNRNPVSGEVIYSQYHKGKYLVAWHPKSSTDNERHTVVLKNDKAEILVKQIAGAVARRIVNYLNVGQAVKQGDEFGFIKFGSRVDVLLPIGSKVNVSLNQIVRGGVTVIATLP